MSGPLSLMISVRLDRLARFQAALDAAPTAGKLQLFDGTQPAPGGAPTALQATITLAKPCAAIAAASDLAVMTFVAEVEGMRFDDKTITWGRFTDGNGVIVGDAKVGQSGDADPAIAIYISNVNGVVGGFVRLSSGIVVE